MSSEIETVGELQTGQSDVEQVKDVQGAPCHEMQPLLGESSDTWAPEWTELTFRPFGQGVWDFPLLNGLVSWTSFDMGAPGTADQLLLGPQEDEEREVYYDEDEQGYLDFEKLIKEIEDEVLIDEKAKSIEIDMFWERIWEQTPRFSLLTELQEDTVMVNEEDAGSAVTFESWTSYRTETGEWTTEHCKTVKNRMFDTDIQEYICDEATDIDPGLPESFASDDDYSQIVPPLGQGVDPALIWPCQNVLFFLWIVFLVHLCCRRRPRKRSAANQKPAFSTDSKGPLLAEVEGTYAVSTSVGGEADHPNNGTYQPPADTHVDTRPALIFI